MSQITLSLDEQLVEKGRKYAQQRGMSLEAMMGKLLERAMASEEKDPAPIESLEEAFRLMDETPAESSTGRRNWRREDLYDV